MQKMKGFSLLAICLAMLWVLTVCGDAQAQGKGQQKDKENKNKKKSEQAMEKKKGKAEKGVTTQKEKGKKEKEKKAKDVEDAIEGAEEGAAKVKQAKKAKYKPKSMTDKDMAEWTDGNPPGWSRGKKTGWGGAGAPPGQMKKQGEQVKERDREAIHIYPPQAEDWDVKKKEEWGSKVEKARTRILGRVETRGDVPKEDEASAVMSLEGAAGQGVPVENAEAVIDKALFKRMRGEDIEKMTRAMSYGADKNTDYNKLGRFVNKKIDDGETGDDIALSVYQEIDDGTMVKKKPWYKRWFSR